MWSPAYTLIVLPAHILTLFLVPMTQASHYLPCRTALPSVCWPVTGIPPTSCFGKALPELTPTPIPGLYPYCPLMPLPQPLTGSPPS